MRHFLQPFLSLHTDPLWASPLSPINNNRISISGFGSNGCEIKKRGNSFYSHRAVERDTEFEFDPDKAREALRKLDQQLKSVSEKKINPPKIRASDLNRARDPTMEEVPEFSGSFLAYSAFALLIFTIFYNLLFFTVIQPSIDGPEPATTSVREPPDEAAVSQKLPPIPEVSAQP